MSAQACLEIDVDVEKIIEIRLPEPLGPGLGFLFAFVVGGILGAVLARFCFRDYLKSKNQDEEKATLIAQGIPLHLRGREKTMAFPATMSATAVVSNEMSLATHDDEWSKRDPRPGTASPTAVALDTSDVQFIGLSAALIKQTGEGAEAEICHQDCSSFLYLEEQFRQERIESLVCVVQIYLNRLVAGNKINEEDANRIVRELKKKCADIVERNTSDEAAAIQALTNNPKLQQNSVAMQTETDKVHAESVQKMNTELSMLESDLPHMLATVDTLTDADIDALMNKLKHQLATREKKVSDETNRQIQALEERLARRKELAEQNRLAKQVAKDTVETKVHQQSENLKVLVKKSSLPAQTAEEILKNYEQDLWKLQQANDDERSEQERLLHEKLAKKRKSRLKKLSNQQKKAREELYSRLGKSSNPADVKAYDEMLDQLHEEMEKTVAELDAEEAKQMTELAQSFLENFTSSTGEVDEQFANQLVEEGSVNEDDVSKIIKLHKAEMKEYRRNRAAEQKAMESKLEGRLALRKKQREESKAEDQRVFQALKHQQEEMVQTVIQGQADITEEAAARIMEEHKRNMETVNNQLAMSKLRQQKQLEERLAQRKARLAEKEKAQELKEHAGETQSKKEKEKLEQEIADEKKKIKDDREKELAALRERLEDETRQALLAQEAQISQLIGQLEVGQARRKNILQKQDKLITELENQLANKVGENPKGYTTTTELMQKHYGQVDNLTATLQQTKERQEQALQERLEQKKLKREAEIKQQIKMEAQQEMENQRARGAGVASNILLEMMLQQRHERAMQELEIEMKVELQRSRDQINNELNAEMMAALSDEGKNFMAQIAANSGITNEDLTSAMQNAGNSIQANDQTVKKLAKEMKVRVKTARGERRQQPEY